MKSSLSIGTRLFVLTGVLLAALVAIVALNLGQLSKLEQSLRTVYLDRTVPAIDLASVTDEVHRSRFRAVLVATSSDAERSASYLTQIADIDRSIDRTWAKYKATYLTPEEVQIAGRVERALAEFREQRDTTLRLASQGQRERAVEESVGRGMQLFNTLRDELHNLLALQDRVAAEEYQRGQDGYAAAFRSSIAITLVALVLGAMLATWIIRSVTRPLADVKQALERVADHGDLSVRVQVESSDELGQTAVTVNKMLDALDATVRDVGVVMGQAAEGNFNARVTARASGDLATIKTSINDALGTLEKVLTELDVTMRALADGDLTARVDAPARGRLDDIKSNVNRSLQSLHDSFAKVIQTVRQVATATHEASAAVGQVSDGAQHQLVALKQVAVGMTQTSQAVVHVTASARDSSQLARDATTLVASGARDMESMVEVVSAIREHSEQVTRITEVISQLASQTNMLSLNAAIEAARAGEHGKGFAVVAEQVGRLAESSGKSVKEIVDLVSRAAKETHRGVEVTSSVRTAIEAIASRVKESDRRAETIAAAMEQQQAAIAEINASVGDLTRIGQSNASAAEEITATMVELAQLAQQTRGTIDRFRLR
jgi:methyl-accepting chemotaxis protein